MSNPVLLYAIAMFFLFIRLFVLTIADRCLSPRRGRRDCCWCWTSLERGVDATITIVFVSNCISIHLAIGKENENGCGIQIDKQDQPTAYRYFGIGNGWESACSPAGIRIPV